VRNHWSPHVRRAVLGMWLTASAGSAFTACERDASTAPTSQPAPAAEAAQRRRAPPPAAIQSASLTEHAWWNQADLVDALSLTGEQRARMDALLLQSMQSLRAAQQGQREQQRALKDALEAGNWEAARQAADAAAASMTTAWRAQTMLKIDVLALLDPDQQRLVTSQYRQVLRQTSVLSRRRGSMRPRAAAPTEQP
jgi:Spy/CpxP family protein refolding chaperone